MIQMALDFATKAHEGQVRKYSGTPYINHPIEVSEILKSVGIDNQLILAAALLHDVVEDCGIPIEVISRDFGVIVASYVDGLTDVSKPEDGNRKTRKAKDLAHTARQSIKIRNIKLADLISNSRSIKFWAESNKEAKAFWKLYKQEKIAILGVCEDCDPELLKMAWELVKEEEG